MRYEYDFRPDFTLKDVNIVRAVRDKGFCFSYRTGRLRHGFIYVVKGKMQNIFFGEGIDKMDVAAGEMIFIPKGCAYTGTFMEDGCEIKIVQFDLESGTLPPYLSAPVIIPLPDVAERMDAFHKSTRGQAFGHPLYHFACLYALLWQIDDLFARIPTRYSRLSPALDHLSLHYAEQKKITDYAVLCGMSEVSFRRLFREYTGCSPVEYRNRLRLADAKNKLQSGAYNVSEAAESAGFSNLSFFIRLYKQKYGYTPKRE